MVFTQVSTFVVPWLLCILILHRIIFCASLPLEDFNFEETIKNIKAVNDQPSNPYDEKYDVFADRSELSAIM